MVYETNILLDAYPLKNRVKTDSGKRNNKKCTNPTQITIYLCAYQMNTMKNPT